MANKLVDLFVKVGADTGGLDKALTGAENKTKSFAGKFSKQMKIAGTAMIGLTVAVAGFSVKAAVGFETAMREVNTMLLLNEEEFQNLSKDVRGVAKDMGVDAVNAAGALYQAISAGIPKENVIEFLTTATKAGIAGMSDTETAASALTTVLNAYKIPVSEAEKVSDALFATVKSGVTTFPQLAASMAQAMPIASALGVEYQEVLGTVATLTKQGVPTAQAFTQIRASLVALSKPTAEMKTLLNAAGYETGEAMMQALGYSGALDKLNEVAAGNNEVLGKALGSVEALQVVFGVTGENAVSAAADLDAVTNSVGAMEDAVKEVKKGTAQQFNEMKAQFTDVAITIGTALIPVIKQLMDTIMPVIEKMSAWVEEHPKLTVGIMAVVAGLGAMLIVLPKIIGLITALKGITMVATIAQWAMNVAMSANPIGLVILAIAGLIAGIIFLVKNFEKVKEVASRVFGTLKNIIVAPFNAAMRGIEAGINWLIRQINKIHVTIPDWVPGLGGKGIGFNISEISMPQLAEGGIVKSPTVAEIGEKGPEAIVPLDKGIGATNVYVTVQGSVIAERDLAQAVREEFLKVKSRNYSLGF